jgi:hypothetical protein
LYLLLLLQDAPQQSDSDSSDSDVDIAQFKFTREFWLKKTDASSEEEDDMDPAEKRRRRQVLYLSYIYMSMLECGF